MKAVYIDGSQGVLIRRWDLARALARGEVLVTPVEYQNSSGLLAL